MAAQVKPNLQSDRVIKSSRPLLMAMEAAKTRQAQQIGENTGLFRAPRVLSFEPGARRLELERIDGICPLARAYKLAPDGRGLMVRIGRSVAAFHDMLRLPASLSLPLPEPWLVTAEGTVVLHGDLNAQNVQVALRDWSPVILDWSITPLFGVEGTIGPRELDIAWFVRSMFFVWSKPGLSRENPACQAAEVFLKSYFDSTSYSPQAEEFGRHLFQFGEKMTRAVTGHIDMSFPRHLWYLWRARRYLLYVKSERFRKTIESILTA
jgi:hypothetical protein